MQRAPGRSGPAPRGTRAAPSVLKGIGLMCVALALFSCLDTTAKYMASVVGLPVTQVVWLRFVSQFLLIMLVAGVVSIPRLLISRRPKQQLARSTLMLFSTLLNFIALRHLRLDQTQTIYFLAPLVVALLAGPFLGEWVGWRRMLAILVGFTGILVVVRPGVTAFEPALIFAFGSMLCYASFMLLTRYLAPFDPPEVTLFYSLIAGTFFMGPLALVDWEWPTSWVVWALLLSMGFWGGIGHYIFIIAYKHAPASTLAPFIYLGLITHTAGGWLVFGQVPDRWTIAGAAIVIASGVYLFHRERVVLAERRAGAAAKASRR
jgi:drug/metabolite transporter (DMT)-like permease